MRVDLEQIRRVIINLVDNAVEALGGARPLSARRRAAGDRRRDDGTMQAMAWRGSSSSDNGPGIPAADRDKLFMPYYSTKRRGSGLGLAIVRRIIAEHGGASRVPSGVLHRDERVTGRTGDPDACSPIRGCLHRTGLCEAALMKATF